MIDWVKDIAAWWTTGVMGLLLYWLPLAFCAVGYVLKSGSEYRTDIKRRDTEKYYSPRITVGTLVGRAVITVVPVANLVAGVFDVAPHVFGKFLEWIGRMFDMPLVKPRPKSDTPS